MVRNGWSPATRMFEAAGAAACQVTDVWEGIGDFFEPGREILLADDGAAVARLVRDTDDALAHRIGQAARRRALAEHTYGQRAVEVDRILRAQSAVQVGGAA
jgi:spore maturation protein CgeB